ncbi:EF-hand domain-containing protein [Sphingomonas sp.]|uniref:EF-hand domain-containing protein n=1 Tax=Sphingomonas sp. TaxID=28214 RepID=UPI00286CE1AC|nr:EF-hand domain-containing protein [Sphingomonas sp.]
MTRIFAGAAASLLLVTGGFLLWQGRAGDAFILPAAPPAGSRQPSLFASNVVPQAPEATAKSREEKRFSRVDKDRDGRIEKDEVFAPRRKAFAKLDTNGNGSLSFEEWAAKSIDKFGGADADHSGWLTPTEYATTAPPPPKHPIKCGC